MNRNESLEEMVARRNKRLIHLFTSNGFDVRIVGDDQKPAVIMNEKVVVSCYVKNFNLYFTKEPFSDEIVRSVKLEHEPKITRLEMEEVMAQCQHRPVYKVKIAGTELFLVGYNYMNQEDSIGRYPVFARHKPKVYFDRAYAEKVVVDLKEQGYEMEIE